MRASPELSPHRHTFSIRHIGVATPAHSEWPNSPFSSRSFEKSVQSIIRDLSRLYPRERLYTITRRDPYYRLLGQAPSPELSPHRHTFSIRHIGVATPAHSEWPNSPFSSRSFEKSVQSIIREISRQYPRERLCTITRRVTPI